MFHEEDEDDESKQARAINRIVHKAERAYDFGADIADEHAKTFGICAKCKNFMFAEGEFTVVFAKCSMFERPLIQKNKIKNCSSFDEKGVLSLWDMKSMAILIDDTEKREVGFMANREEEEKIVNNI